MHDTSSWIERFQGLADLDPKVRKLLATQSSVIEVPAGSSVFGPGQRADNFLLLLSGRVRVQKTSSGGREIVLYRIAAGESCVLTTACLLSHDAYLADGITETDVEAIAIPRDTFDELIAISDGFRKFVFSAYSNRITELFKTIEEIAFSKIDIRLAKSLMRLADGEGKISMTHQELAQELGTAREVISRHLQEFQRRGWIGVARGQISLSDPDALNLLAQSD